MERLGRRAAALEAMMSFAFALNSTGETDLAIAAYRCILEIDANRYDARLNLGALMVNKGMREGIAHLVKGIALCAVRQPRITARPRSMRWRVPGWFWRRTSRW